VVNIKKLKDTEQKEAELYPELNQGLGVYDENGIFFIERKREQFSAIAKRYIQEMIIAELKGSTVKVLMSITSLLGSQRFTNAGNKCIGKYAGVDGKTVREALKELEYYHIIKRNLIPSGSRKKRKRRIVLHRWDTAKPLLVKDRKIMVDEEGKVIFVIPNPFRKSRIPLLIKTDKISV